ncbi:MAG TPA: hypothetical protein VIK93_05505 [Limnochordales bacterium]
MSDAETGSPPGEGQPQGTGEAAAGGVRTPLGTMVIVLIYAAATVILWAYVYYHMLRYGGGLGGH